jgi:predicted transcriptional regulator
MTSKTKKHKIKPLPLRLRMIRDERNLSQVEMAELVGVTQPVIGRIEKGTYNWNQAFLQSAAEMLGKSPIELLPISIMAGGSNSTLFQLYELLQAAPEHERQRALAALEAILNFSERAKAQ